MPQIGHCYQWSELPGTGHGYVRFKDGRVVCANLKPELNPDAPEVILVGQGPLREKWAKMLCDQDHSIALEVYLKKGVNKWKYEGDFVVENWSEAKEEIQQHETRANRCDVFRIINLRKK
jgi:hypothetical protein